MRILRADHTSHCVRTVAGEVQAFVDNARGGPEKVPLVLFNGLMAAELPNRARLAYYIRRCDLDLQANHRFSISSRIVCAPVHANHPLYCTHGLLIKQRSVTSC
jgi:hypothetical protein